MEADNLKRNVACLKNNNIVIIDQIVQNDYDEFHQPSTSVTITEENTGGLNDKF